ncbi:MAG: hypothetical protein IPI48_14160 [bacterium]|nr:hypothetical protein [bacterium]
MSCRLLCCLPALLLPLLAACGDNDPATTPPPGGVLATFAVAGEQFSVLVTHEPAIADLLALWQGGGAATIPSGKVVRGAAPENAPWTWHLDGEDFAMAEVTIELCDGTPSYVEAHLDEWIEQVGRYCPWAAQLVALEDRRFR